MSKEAMKLALEALKQIDEAMPFPVAKLAQAALREALAQSRSDEEQPAQQEPVAYSYTSRITGAQGFSHHPMPRFVDSESWDIKPLYTRPQAREGVAVCEYCENERPVIHAPAREWVGLTDEERGQVYASWRFNGSNSSNLELCRAIEAAHGIGEKK